MRLVRFDTGGVEPERQFDLFYAHVTAQILRLEPIRPPGGGPFRARAVSLAVGGRSAHLLAAPGHAARRSARHIRPSDPHELHLTLMLAGERRVSAGEREIRAGPGDLFFLDSLHPFAFASADGAYLGVKVVFPAPSMPPRRAQTTLPAPAALVASPLAGALKALMRHLAVALDRGRPETVCALAAAAELLALSMLRGEGFDAIEYDRPEAFTAILLEVERRLADPDFDLGRLGAVLGVSPRHVQRVLARHGTSFSALLRERRIALARRRLAAGDGPVEQIAWDVGYREVSAFYRAFRRLCGHPPGAERHRAGAPGG